MSAPGWGQAVDAQLLEPGVSAPGPVPATVTVKVPPRSVEAAAAAGQGGRQPVTGRGSGALGMIALSASAVSLAERAAAHIVVVTATLGGGAVAASELAVEVRAAPDGTAVAGSDYAAFPATVARIGAGGSSAVATVTIGVTADGILEPHESIVLTGSATGYDVVPETLTVTDADRATLGVSRGPLYLLHAERGRYFTFSVTMDVAAEAELVVPWRVYSPPARELEFDNPVSGSRQTVTSRGADAGDVSPSSGEVTLGGAAGMAGPVITLEVVDDELSEGYESVGVEIGSPVAHPAAEFAGRIDIGAGGGVVVGHIGPSDPVTVSLSGPDAVAEGGRASYTVHAAGVHTPSVPLTVRVSGTGVAAADVSGMPMTAVIPAFARSVTFDVDIVADTAIEGEETLTMSISDPAGGGGENRLHGLHARVETRILDGDHSPLTVVFGEATLTATAGGSPAVVTVILSGAPGRPVTVAVTKTLEGGVTEDDHGGVPDRVVFPPQGTAASFTVSAAAGSSGSGTRVVLGFGSLPSGVSAGSGASATVTLAPLQGTITLSASVAGGVGDALLEGHGLGGTLTLGAGVQSGATPSSPLFIRPFVSEHSEAGDGDHNLGTIQDILLGGAAATVENVVRNDNVVEIDEALVITAHVPGYHVEPVTVDIRDSDSAHVVFTPSVIKASYREGEVVEFVPYMTRLVEAEIGALLQVGGANPEDFSPRSGVLSFHGVDDVTRTGGALYAGPPFLVTLVDDDLSEGRERFRLYVSRNDPTPGDLITRLFFSFNEPVPPIPGGSPRISMALAPSDPLALSLSGPGAVAEGSAATYTVSVLSGAVARLPVTVDISVEGAGAGDLSGVPASVTIPETASSATFTAMAVADGTDEGDETVTVTIANPAGGGGGGFREFVSSRETTITDPGGPARVTASFAQGVLAATEGDAVTATVRLDAPPGRAVSIPVVHVFEGGAGSFDVGAIPANVDFGPAETEATLPVAAVDDSRAEAGERVRLRFGDLPAGVSRGIPGEALVLLEDAAPAGLVRLVADPATVTEGFGDTVVVTATISGAPPSSDLVLALSEESRGGASGSDHTLELPATPAVTIAPGDTSGSVSVTLTVPDDAAVESGRAVVVSATAPGHAVAPATVSVEDDDRAALAVDTYEDFATEIRVEVTLDGPVDAEVTVPWSVTDGDGDAGPGDIEPSSGTFVFERNAGERDIYTGDWQATRHVNVTVRDDTVSDGTENLRIRLGDPAVAPDPGLASRIGFLRRESPARQVSDPRDPLTVTLVSGGATSVPEGASASLTASLVGANRPGAPLTVSLGAAPAGSSPASREDYEVPPSVIIPPGEVTAVFPVRALNDVAVENNETVIVVITGARGGGGDGVTVAGRSEVTVTISEGAAVTVGFAALSRQFTGQGDVADVSVTLSAPVSFPTTVDLMRVLEGGAAAGDFDISSMRLVFARDQTVRAFAVTVLADPADIQGTHQVELNPSPPLAADPDRSRVAFTVRRTNGQPMFDSASDSLEFTVAETLAFGAPIGDPISATDPDNDGLAYTLEEDADPATPPSTDLFGIDGTGQLRVASVSSVSVSHPLDYETRTSHTLVVAVRDNRGAMNELDSTVDDRVTVTITVEDVNEPPAVDFFRVDTFAVVSELVQAYGTAVFTPTLADVVTDPEGDTLTYSFLAADGATTTVSAPLTIAADTGRITADIGGEGVLGRDGFDFEADSTIALVVGISDGKDAAGNADTGTDVRVTHIVSVTDGDDEPDFVGIAYQGTVALSVAETLAPQSRITTFDAADQDGDPHHVYFFASDDPRMRGSLDPFTVGTDGVLALAAGMTLDFETEEAHTLRLAVAARSIADSTQQEVVSSIGDVIFVEVEVGDVNEPPLFDNPPASGTVSVTLAENAAGGTSVTTLTPATDPEGDGIRYFFWDEDALAASGVSGPFTLGTDGTLRVRSPPTLDHETAPEVTMTVGISDYLDWDGNTSAVPIRVLGEVDTVTVVATVTGVNEPPVFIGPSGAATVSVSVPENSGAGALVGPPLATDPEGDALSFTMEEDGDPATPSTAGLFGIGSGTGQITVLPGAVLNHEAVEAYTVIVEVSDLLDESGMADPAVDVRATVEISVSDVNEPPMFENPPPTGTLTVNLPESAPSNALVAEFPFSDPDGNFFAFAFSGPLLPIDFGPFGLTRSSGSGILRLFGSLDHETQEAHTLTLVISDLRDADGNVVDIEDAVRVSMVVVVSVTDVNEPPVFSGVAGDEPVTLALVENPAAGARVGPSFSATDPERAEVTYSLAEDADPATPPTSGLFGIESDTGQVTVVAGATVDHEDADSHTVVVEASDGTDLDGNADASADASVTAVITVSDVNEPPVFDSGTGDGTLTLTLPEDTAVNTSVAPVPVAVDPEGHFVSHWFLDDSTGDTVSRLGPFIIVLGGNVFFRLASTLDHEAQEELTFTVVASDSRDLSGDPLPDTELGSRVLVSLPVVVSVTDVNEAPVFEGVDGDGTVSLSLDENSPEGTQVGTPFSATDPESAAVSYSLAEDSDPATPPTSGLFGIDSGTGQVTVLAGAVLDHEDVPSHTVLVEASDGTDLDGNADTSADSSVTVVIAVENVNEPPAFGGGATVSRAVAENPSAGTEVGAPVSATDPERNALSYSLEEDSDPDTPPTSGLFGIDSGTGQVTVAAGAVLDHEAVPAHTVVVGVGDGLDDSGAPDTAVDARVTVEISVDNRNDPPVFVNPPPSGTLSVELPESSPDDAQVVALPAASDQDGHNVFFGFDSDSDNIPFNSGPFAIVRRGEDAVMVLSERIDHEETATHTLTVVISDLLDESGNTAGPEDIVRVSLVVVVSVTDVNEAPVFAGVAVDGTVSLSLDENPAAGTQVGAPFSATDPEGAAVTYSLGEDSDPGTPPTSGLFGIGSGTGQITVAAGAVLDHEDAGSHTVLVAAGDGTGPDGNADTSADSSVTVVIAVEDVNEPPVFAGVADGGTVSLSLDENSPPGTPVGTPFSATDPEGAAVSYSLGEDSDPATPPALGLFGIDSGTGQVTVAAGAVLDHEDASSHTVLVSVSDGTDLAGSVDTSADAGVTAVIAVEDVDEPPGPPVSLSVAPVAVGVGLRAAWSAPESNTGPPVTYEVQYKEADQDVYVTDQDPDHGITRDGTGTVATIGGLEAETEHDVRVRAVNDEGESAWVTARGTTGSGVDLRVSPREEGDRLFFDHRDALLIFYSLRFGNFLLANSRLLELVYNRVLAASLPLEEVEEIVHRSRALQGEGGIADSHPANLYGADGFDHKDALLLFYSLRFGNFLLANPRLLELVYNRVLATSLPVEEFEAMIHAARALGDPGEDS